MGRPAGLQLPHFAHLLSEQGGHAGGWGEGCQEHPRSKGQASQDGEGEQSHLRSNQLGHKKEDGKLKAVRGTQFPSQRGWESRVSARERLEGA